MTSIFLCVPLPVDCNEIVEQIYSPHVGIVLPNHVEDGDLDVGPLCPTEPLTGGSAHAG
jgi:hypothetical protein